MNFLAFIFIIQVNSPNFLLIPNESKLLATWKPKDNKEFALVNSKLFKSKELDIIMRYLNIIKNDDHISEISTKNNKTLFWPSFTCKVRRSISQNLSMVVIEKNCNVDLKILKYFKALISKGIRVVSRVAEEVKSKKSSILESIKQNFNILVLADLLED